MRECFLGHDIVEVVEGKLLVTVEVRPLDDFLQLLVVDVLAELLCDLLKVFNRDVGLALLVEEVEDTLKVFLWVLLRDPCCHHVEEFLEVDRSAAVLVEVLDHIINGGVLGVEAERLHRVEQLRDGDLADAVDIKDVEGFLNLLDFVSSESRPLVVFGNEDLLSFLYT